MQAPNNKLKMSREKKVAESSAITCKNRVVICHVKKNIWAYKIQFFPSLYMKINDKFVAQFPKLYLIFIILNVLFYGFLDEPTSSLGKFNEYAP